MIARAAVLVLAACWTGPVAPPPAPPPPPPRAPHLDLDVKMERTACFGRCPEYSIEIHGDGTIVWHGIANVTPLGTTVGRTAPAHMRELDRALHAARFFDLDEAGHLPVDPDCTPGGQCSFTSVTMCSDTPHAIITVRRAGRTHRVDNAHCDPHAALAPLEDAIDRAAGRSR
ncbi:MAG TPA: DUF6438 domain-containing protein [Kofleriaceae bacterium]